MLLTVMSRRADKCIGCKALKPVRVFNVIPSLPEPLEPLRELAYNLRWAWDHDSIELFRRLDTDLWESTGHNPVQMLGSIDQMRLVSAAADDSFLAHLERVSRALETRMGQNSWVRRVHSPAGKLLVAYFSAEFGLTECLSIFAGGLGVLAGDHVKSASDLGVPLVGVGLLYQQGYFHQYLSQAGWQQEEHITNDFHNLPLRPLARPDGKPLTIEVQFPGRAVTARIWWAQAGRGPVYLLDTNVAANSPADREITGELYGGDTEMRLKQEILLGIGGYRALEAAHVQPAVYHMNEGHSAFLSLEHVRRLMERYQLSFREARELASPILIFTSHTPVEAGHDYFAADLMGHYFTEYYQGLGLNRNDFLALGRRNAGDQNELFCMTVLALRLAASSNGVSKLHGEVSRRMWQGIWPGVPVEEVPIGHVTNGVHFRSWISNEMNQLYDRYLGPQWRDAANGVIWRRVETIPAAELWRTHERRRERLVAFARRKLRDQLKRRGAPQSEIDAADEVLDPEALTIGFARRFATYKRATLLLSDTERLKRILLDAKRPVQIIFAGKAHPRDGGGKELIQRIVALARDPVFRRHVVFLEDQDMAVSRYLVGLDASMAGAFALGVSMLPCMLVAGFWLGASFIVFSFIAASIAAELCRRATLSGSLPAVARLICCAIACEFSGFLIYQTGAMYFWAITACTVTIVMRDGRLREAVRTAGVFAIAGSTAMVSYLVWFKYLHGYAAALQAAEPSRGTMFASLTVNLRWFVTDALPRAGTLWIF